jgi:hypothetical protein
MTRRRIGATLVELLVVITLIAIIFAIVGVLLRQALLGAQTYRGDLLYLGAMSRLAERFREDVHAASPEGIDMGNSAQEASDLSRTILTLRPAVRAEFSRVEYQFRPGALERVVLREASLISRERFALQRDWSVHPEISATEPTVASLVVARGDREDASTPLQPLLRIDANLGADSRWSLTEDGQ